MGHAVHNINLQLCRTISGIVRFALLCGRKNPRPKAHKVAQVQATQGSTCQADMLLAPHYAYLQLCRVISSIAPADALLTTGLRGAQFREQASTPDTPRQYADRSMAPRFCCMNRSRQQCVDKQRQAACVSHSGWSLMQCWWPGCAMRRQSVR